MRALIYKWGRKVWEEMVGLPFSCERQISKVPFSSKNTVFHTVTCLPVKKVPYSSVCGFLFVFLVTYVYTIIFKWSPRDCDPHPHSVFFSKEWSFLFKMHKVYIEKKLLILFLWWNNRQICQTLLNYSTGAFYHHSPSEWF